MDNKKLYNLRQIQIWCVLGSPFVAGILISQNCSKFGEARKSTLWIFIGTLWTLALFGIAMLIPDETTRSAGMLIPLLNGALIHPIVDRLQGERIREHFENDGAKSSNGLPIVLSVILIALIVTPTILLDRISNFNNYLRADFNGNGVFYTQNTSIEEVDKLGSILTRVDYFNSENPVEVVFADCDSVIELKLVTDKDYFDNSEFLNEMLPVFKHLSFYDFSKPVRFNLIDEYLKTGKRINLSQSDSIQYLMESVPFIKNENFRLYYDIMIPEIERSKFQDLILKLDNLFPHQYQFNFICEVADSSFLLNLYIPKKEWNNPKLISEAKLLKTELNQSDFSKPFRVKLFESSETNYEEFEIQ
ncbi:hypothetical protein [uncultured Draconibacterium sp.]|uniref:hypothetical protein n=1 Tax=uncultured Draconibacterium sp. TaxID=1573823 RepID=UPI0029C7D0C8|nr:hypothetical protein [uncultured Draconibacterium sp.]